MPLPVLRLAVRDPIAAFAAELREQAAAIQDRPAFAIEALTVERSDDLQPVNAVLEAERCVGPAWSTAAWIELPASPQSRRTGRAAFTTPCVAGAEAAATGLREHRAEHEGDPNVAVEDLGHAASATFAQVRRSPSLWR